MKVSPYIVWACLIVYYYFRKRVMERIVGFEKTHVYGSNPGGWAIIGIAAAGVVVSMGADHLYKNNETVEKTVDW